MDQEFTELDDTFEYIQHTLETVNPTVLDYTLEYNQTPHSSIDSDLNDLIVNKDGTHKYTRIP